MRVEKRPRERPDLFPPGNGLDFPLGAENHPGPFPFGDGKMISPTTPVRDRLEIFPLDDLPLDREFLGAASGSDRLVSIDIGSLRSPRETRLDASAPVVIEETG
jgi:hypothetical protein